jgi:hypothetical protein
LHELRDRMHGLRQRHAVVDAVAIALAAVGLAVAMTWPLALHLGSVVGGYVGDPLFEAWQVAWVGHAFLHQPLHVFQSNTAWPLRDSLAFSDAPVGYAPAGLLAQSGPHGALVVYNLLVLFAYALAFLGTYLLARELGAGRLGGLAAGVAFAYTPWRLGQTGHLHVISTGGVPLTLFLLTRGYRRGSARLVLAGWLVAGWQVTLGFTIGLQLLYLLVPVAAIGIAIWLRAHRPPLDTRVLGATAAGVVVFGVLTVNMALPYLRVLHDHPEARRTLAEVVYYSPPPSGFLAAPEQSYLWGGATAGIRSSSGLSSEEALFPGITIAVLALLGLFSSVYSRRVRLWLFGSIGLCALLSLGIHSNPAGIGKYVTPYRLLYDFAPGWDGVRTPGRINTLTSLGLALLAGAGLCLVLQLTQRLDAHRRVLRPAAAACVSALCLGAILLEGLGPPAQPRVPPAPPGQRDRASPQLHLPFDWDIPAILYLYWSTAGFPAVVNEYGSFQPVALQRLRTVMERFPDARSVQALRHLGVRTVILHPDLARGTRWQRTATRSIAGLPLRREKASGVVVYTLTPSSVEARSP